MFADDVFQLFNFAPKPCFAPQIVVRVVGTFRGSIELNAGSANRSIVVALRGNISIS